MCNMFIFKIYQILKEKYNNNNGTKQGHKVDKHCKTVIGVGFSYCWLNLEE